MKITIDIDCTPQEARAFLGLPNVEPIQDAVLAKAQERLTEYLEARDPEALLKLWFPGGLQELASDAGAALAAVPGRPGAGSLRPGQVQGAALTSAHAVGGTWSLKRSRKAVFMSLPVAVWGSSSTNTTSSGSHQLATLPAR